MLVLVSDLARRLALATPLSKDPLKEGQGIVLIDEIDLHLHPRWQIKVMDKLQKLFPKIQWVISTHSPLIISHTPNNKATVLMLSNQKIEEKQFFYGKDISTFIYDYYGITTRPKDIQEKISKNTEGVLLFESGLLEFRRIIRISERGISL